MQRKLTAVPETQNFESPLAPANASQVSADGHSALLRFQIRQRQRGDGSRQAGRSGRRRRRAGSPGFTLGEFGDASTQQQINKVVQDDFGKALKTSLPVTLIILLLAFGALVAAGVPLLLALTAVMATIGIMGPLSHVIGGVDSSINEVILLIGLAVGVDYSMFYLRREREEREAGRSEEASLAAAAATSGRAVLVSGFTVMIAMAGMYLAGYADVPVVCHRHHPGRRRGTRRLADGAAGDPVVARRPGGEGRRPDHQGSALERRREPHVAARS